MKSPYPYFGGKSSIASIVWERFGSIENYVEPFFGSGAVLLAKEKPVNIETVNDMNVWLVNFWRAVVNDPKGVAKHADYPVSEIDIHARGDWLFYRPLVDDFVKNIRNDPDYFDSKSAAWWVYGMSWAFSGSWGKKKVSFRGKRKVSKSRPGIGSKKRGLYNLDGEYDSIETYLSALCSRLKETRIMSGDWSRVVVPSITTGLGLTGVFLDPPYAQVGRNDKLYGENDDLKISSQVRRWCIENGENKLLRIALAGYDVEHKMPDNWEIVDWKAQGGMGNTGEGRGKDNAKRERLWFSPHCLQPATLFSLFKD